MQAKVLSINAGLRNATDLMSTAQLADRAYDSVTSILQRANQVAIQSTNSIYSDADRIALNTEIQNLINEVDNISNGTKFFNNALLNGII